MPLYTHVEVNMLYLAVYPHTSLGFTDIFVRNALECFPSCFLSLQASIDTEDVVHLLRLCFVSRDPVGICFSSQCRVSRSINGCGTTSWKQLQKAWRKGFFYPPCIFKKFFSRPSTLIKALLRSQEHVWSWFHNSVLWGKKFFCGKLQQNAKKNPFVYVWLLIVAAVTSVGPYGID